MRLTWVVLGVVAAAGVIAFLSGTASEDEAATSAQAADEQGAVNLGKGSVLDGPVDLLAPDDGTHDAERRAVEVHLQLAKAEAAGDGAAGRARRAARHWGGGAALPESDARSCAGGGGWCSERRA